MKKIIRYLREELDFSIEEAKSAFWFVVLLISAVFAYNLFSQLSSNRHSSVLIEENEWTELPEKKDFQEYESKFEYNTTDSKGNNYVKFRFDPNTLSQEEFNRLGFPVYISKSIINYRNKGGKFKFKEDLLKIYVMKPQVYDEFSEYINLPSKFEAKSNDFEEDRKLIQIENGINESEKFTKNEIRPEKFPIKSNNLSKFDINTADTTQLKKLKGIGSGYATRIIKYRDLLGGFGSIDHVSKTYNIPDEVVEEIKKWAFVGVQPKKIKINEVDNIKHPFLKYNQAKAIVAYRKQHGNFKSKDDLLKVLVLDPKTIDELIPYIEF